MVLIVRSEWRGRGCSHSCSMGGSWEVSQACSHQVGGGLPVQRVRRQLSIALHIQYSQVNVTHATRDNHHWVRNSTLPPAYSSCPPPCWPAAPVGRAPAPLFFPDSPPFSTQIPQSMQRVLQGLEVVPDLPSPKVKQGGYLHQPAPCGSLGLSRSGATLGAATSWPYWLVKSSNRCPF